jgi:hypothetical protein
LLVAAGGVLGALAGAAILTASSASAPADTPRLDEIRWTSSVLSRTTLSVVPVRSCSACCPH